MFLGVHMHVCVSLRTFVLHWKLQLMTVEFLTHKANYKNPAMHVHWTLAHDGVLEPNVDSEL